MHAENSGGDCHRTAGQRAPTDSHRSHTISARHPLAVRPVPLPYPDASRRVLVVRFLGEQN